MTKPVETVDRFYELVCAGGSVRAAAVAVGVSRTRSGAWWRRSAPMGLKVVMGPVGGLPGCAPPRERAGGVDVVAAGRRRALSSEDRAVIAAGVRQHLTYQQIGDLIGRAKSVVWREVHRNCGPDRSYWAPLANRVAHEHRRRPKAFKLVQQPGLCRQIESWMDQGWSPKLIASMLASDHPPGSIGRVSHETIYSALYVQTRGVLRADLHRQLSLKRSRRKPRSGRSRSGSAAIFAHAFTISQRPAEVDDRAVPGHWEGDLILGAGGASAVGTLVERSTRFTMLLHLPARHDANTVAETMITQMQDLPEHLRRSLTWDRGSELAQYERIQLQLAIPIYFCDPHSPWQRGSNENTNRLLRFWFEKGTDLTVHTAADLRRIADTLNRRPRPTLDLQTPAQRLSQLLTRAA
jgi:IS30 family transposase